MLDKWMRYATHDGCLIVWIRKLVLFPCCYGWVEPADLYVLYIKYFWSSAVSKQVKFNTNSDPYVSLSTYRRFKHIYFMATLWKSPNFIPLLFKLRVLLSHFKKLCHACNLVTAALVLRSALLLTVQLQDTLSIVQVPQCDQAPGHGSISFCTIFSRNMRNAILLIL